MTKKDYFRQRFASLGLSLTEADLLDLNVPNLEGEAKSEEQEQMYIAFIKFIPQILLHPTSISEGGTSISRANKDDIIPCHIVANTLNQRGVFKDSTFTQSSFTVWFDYGLYVFSAKRVRLINNKNEVLGEFEVQSIEHADLVGRTKITV